MKLNRLNLPLSLVFGVLATSSASAQVVIDPGQPSSEPASPQIRRMRLPAPTAGGRDIPDLGMHDIKHDGAALPSGVIEMLPGTIASEVSPPRGMLVRAIYLPDFFGDITFDADDEYPQNLWFTNVDPSGSLDESVFDDEGNPIHFNLHWPEEPATQHFIRDFGLEPNSPTDDLEEILDDIVATGSKARIAEALDILLGTNVSGALSNKVYNGFELLRYKGRKDNQTFDPKTRDITVTQLWYDTEIYSSHNMMQVPAHGDYTITWKVYGLGDPGPNNEFAFPIDEQGVMPMKQVANSLFWKRNAWIWKWFDVVETVDTPRKYSLESMYELHTGSSEGGSVPTYSDINPGDPRYWLHANRKLDYGSYVGGGGDITDTMRWHSTDLDQDGQIGGYLADGTDTGSPYDAVTNAAAQFNTYRNNEYAVPLLDWSQGPAEVPYFGYDSTFNTIYKGKTYTQTIRYSKGEQQAGLYNWGWRIHPPRINWIETYAEGQILASGAPKDWRFGHKWDEVGEMGLAALGSHSPEMVIHDALLAFDAGPGTQSEIDDFAADIEGMMALVRDRRGLPPTDDIPDFPNASADLNLLMSNLDFFGDRSRISAAGQDKWSENDSIVITIHNDDNVERYFRVVDFGTTDYQYNGLDMGLFDWKPVFGFPQFAASAWGGLFGPQGYANAQWAGSDLQGSGNPFFVPPNENTPATFWNAGERDLVHHYDDLTSFSGPGFHTVNDGAYTVWGSNLLATKPTGDSNLWRYSYGKPIAPHTTVTFSVEMPRAQALNNGAMYIFDPQFHFASIFTNHPVSELVPESLDD